MEFTSIKINIFREFLPDNVLFRADTYQSYYQILFTFQSSHKPILIISEKYYQTTHSDTFRRVITPLLFPPE